MPDLPTLHRMPAPPVVRRSFEVTPAAPMVWHDMVTEHARHELIEYWRREREAGRGLPPAFRGDDVPPAELVMPPDEYSQLVRILVVQVGDYFGLPCSPSSAAAAIARYAPGAGVSWHLDAAPAMPSSMTRTVAFTLLLNADFEDGDLEFDPGGAVELAAGDLCGFTSRTWHRVAPVRSGERFALVAFGGFGEPS